MNLLTEFECVAYFAQMLYLILTFAVSENLLIKSFLRGALNWCFNWISRYVAYFQEHIKCYTSDILLRFSIIFQTTIQVYNSIQYIEASQQAFHFNLYYRSTDLRMLLLRVLFFFDVRGFWAIDYTQQLS